MSSPFSLLSVGKSKKNNIYTLGKYYQEQVVVPVSSKCFLGLFPKEFHALHHLEEEKKMRFSRLDSNPGYPADELFREIFFFFLSLVFFPFFSEV